MPINIFVEETGEKLTWLCGEKWDLASQIEALEEWLMNEGKSLVQNKYVADLGFCIRNDARGGGGVLSSESMRIMGMIGMDLFLSEYP